MGDTISRQAAIDALADMHCKSDEDGYVWIIRSDAWARIDALPPAQTTLGGYDVEHLVLIAKLLEKEKLPPERVSDALYDISQVVDIVVKEFEETLENAMKQSMVQTTESGDK